MCVCVSRVMDSHAVAYLCVCILKCAVQSECLSKRILSVSVFVFTGVV